MATGQWWVVLETSASNPLGQQIVVSGTQEAVFAKYGGPGPQIQGPFATQAAAQQAANNEPGISGNPPTAIKQGVQSAANSISSSVLGPLFQSNIWLRVAEVVAGLVLLGIGLNAMLKGRPLAVVTGAAGAVGKVVP